jgi:hypothetical protein
MKKLLIFFSNKVYYQESYILIILYISVDRQKLPSLTHTLITGARGTE